MKSRIFPLAFKAVISVFLLFCASSARAVSLPDSLSEKSEFHLLTCGPGSELYSLFGHTAIRLQDSLTGTDIVFNYGTFDFNTDNFYYKFVKGILPYQLSVETYNSFLMTYTIEDRSVFSQKLCMDREQKMRLWELLRENCRPENRTYQYNFLYDNCSSRVRDIILEAFGGNVDFPDSKLEDSYLEDVLPSRGKSYWNMLDEYMVSSEWIKWGIHTILGYPATEKVTVKSSMFLPDYLMAHFSEGVTSEGNHIVEPYRTVMVSEAEICATPFLLSPLCVYTAIAVLVFVLLYVLRIRKIAGFRKTVVVILYIVTGLAGALFVFLGYFTSHPTVAPNFNMVWANPLNLIVVWFLFSGNRKVLVVVKYYMIAYLVLLAVAFCLWWLLQPSVSMVNMVWIAIAFMVSMSYLLDVCRRLGMKSIKIVSRE